MCYAIPGKVTDINENIVTVDYFGEKKKARNDFFVLNSGDFVYAQGGFVIQKIASQEAEAILETWEELFLKLKQTDLKLTEKTKDLRAGANSLRHKYSGNSCCVHGIIEFSNYCRNDCLYCGIRCGNPCIVRYRMTAAEIVKTAQFSVNKLKFKALVLQSGEDLWYDEDRLSEIIRNIRLLCPSLLILSIGERETRLYERLYREGARGALLRFETSNKTLYEKMKPGRLLESRIDLIKKLHEIGYLVMTGFLIGLPGETKKDGLNNIKLTNSLNADMFSCGPFIPHSKTPLADESSSSFDQSLDTIARMRLMNPKAKILVTTALESLGKNNGLKLGLLSGGNSLMINLTPKKYRQLYDIYPSHSSIDTEIPEKIASVVKLLYSIGRAPVDIGV